MRGDVPDVIDHGVVESIGNGVVESIGNGFVVEGTTSHCSIVQDTVTQVGGFDVVDSRSKGRFPRGLHIFFCSLFVIEIC